MRFAARVATLLLVLLPALLLGLSVRAASAQEVLIPADHYPPWKFAHGDAPVSGIDIEIIDAVLDEAGLSPVYQKRPWKRCLKMMETGEADLMNGLLRRSGREKYMHFIEPPYKTRTTKAFYVPKGRAEALATYDNLVGLRIGVTLGAQYFKRFDDDITLQKEVVAEDILNLRKLVAGRIDTFVTTEVTGDYLVASSGMADRVEKAVFKHEQAMKVYFGVSRNSELMAHVPKLSEAIRKLVESGRVEEIIQRYIRNVDR